MKALLVVDSDASFALASVYLKPLGFELIRYRSPLKAMDNMDEVDPDAVIVNAEDFPRHWKTVVQFIRSERNKMRTTVVVLKGTAFSYEDAAKAAQIGVDGIASVDLDDPEELDRLQDILGRYRPVTNGRKAKRLRPADRDRVDFICVLPETGRIAAGRVTSLSSTGLAFDPEDSAAFASFPPGARFDECSLRIGAAILSPACELVRGAPQAAFSLSFAESAERESLDAFIVGRPLRERLRRG